MDSEQYEKMLAALNDKIYHAMCSAGEAGKDVIQAYFETALTAFCPDIRREMLQRLNGADAAGWVEPLVRKMLSDPDESVRQEATYILGTLSNKKTMDD